MALAGFREPRWAFLALPFEVRDRTKSYKETLLVLEDLFDIKITHGDNTNDAVGIFDRAAELMAACRVRIFDLTSCNTNVIFEFGHATGAGLKNVYAIRRKGGFGQRPLPSMLKHIDCQEYDNSRGLEKTLAKALGRHFWPVDRSFTLDKENLDWLETQIRELTFPICEVDKFELEAATKIDSTFVTQAIVQRLVPSGEATALSVGPAPKYRFDYRSVREIGARQASGNA